MFDVNYCTQCGDKIDAELADHFESRPDVQPVCEACLKAKLGEFKDLRDDLLESLVPVLSNLAEAMSNVYDDLFSAPDDRA